MKKYISTLIIFAVLFGAWFFVGRNVDFYQGNKIVSKIEEYRDVNKILPSSLEDIGLIVDESSKFFYEVGTDSNYVLYFNIGFDDTWTYYSDTKKWEWGLDRSRIGIKSKYEAISQVTFTCPNQKLIEAFFYKDKTVDVTLYEGSEIILEQNLSTLKSQYSNEDKSVVFWVEGDEQMTTYLQRKGTDMLKCGIRELGSGTIKYATIKEWHDYHELM